MLRLADVQSRLRDAVVLGRTDALRAMLVGGHDPLARLDVHRRHYETSLVESVLRRFPGAVWLLGDAFMRGVAQDFVRHTPPTAPCIAEYAADFPDFLGGRREVDGLPYAAFFARLEWHLGQVACAVDAPAIGMRELAAFGADSIPELVLLLQPGTAYLEAPWPVDELARLHVSESPPDRFEIEAEAVFLQVRGSRGAFTIERLDPGSFIFRQGTADGLTIGEAAERALSHDGTFDPGSGLTGLIADGLAIAAHGRGARA